MKGARVRYGHRTGKINWEGENRRQRRILTA